MSYPEKRRLSAVIFPIPKRLFDFWFKLFEDMTKWSLVAAVPYFKLSSAPITDRWLNILGFFFVASISYYVMYLLTEHEAWMIRKED